VTANLVRLMTIGAAFVVSLSAADQPGAFGIGVLRRDGAVIPIAAYDGKRWSRPWPEPRLDLTIPITLSGVPKKWWGPTPALEQWQVTTAAGPRALRVTQPDWVDLFCVRQIGLRTDYRPDQMPPPPTVQPYPKDGLAVSPTQAVERVEIVSPGALEVQSLAPVLLESFNRAERKVEGQSGHPIARRAREGVAPTIEAVYALGTTPRVYYVEAGRLYRRLGQSLEDCEAFAFGTGWFVRDAAGVRSLTMAVDLLGCDRVGASYMLPLGAMRLADRLFWIAQFSGWDHERYVIVEMKPKGVELVANVWGGGC
jgi:hypothetical protein